MMHQPTASVISFKACPICGSSIANGPNEFDRLQAQVTELQAALQHAYAEAHEERSAAIAYLAQELPNRDNGLTFPPSVVARRTLDQAAEAFKNGAHRRKL